MIPTPSQHPLPRDGTSQERRQPPALDPARRLLDDRGVDDLLHQVRRLSPFLTYHDLGNQARGTWEPFFAPHFAVRLAGLAHADIAAFRAAAAAATAALEGAAPDQQDALRRRLHLLCARQLGRVDADLEALHSTAFGPLFERSVFSLLRPASLRLVAVARAAGAAERDRWLDPVREQLKSDHWRLDLASVPAAPDVPDAAAFGPALEAALRTLADQLAVLGERVAHDAASMLADNTLEDGRQPPHVGLLLAWLRLFHHAQDSLNDLVRRHLEFYYRCLLRMEPRAAVPDRAIAVVEPARNTESHRLPAGTLLYAGKDPAKAVIEFGLVRDLLVNRAAVAGLRSIYRDPASNGLIRAAPVANSGDGLGGALPEDSPSWAAFGHAGLPAGRRGLAVAAPVLRLTGGTKRITLALALSPAARDTLVARCLEGVADGAPARNADDEWPLDGLFQVALTGPEGWWTPDAANVQIRFAPDADTPVLRVQISGVPVDQAVSDYDPAVHGLTYDTAWPLIELTRSTPTASQPGDLLDGLELAGATVECQVTGDTHLVVASDQGTLDPAKPFQPFGSSPSVNSSFYIGSREIFSKTLTALAFAPVWKDLPRDLAGYFRSYAGHSTPRFLLTPAFLEGGEWRALGTTGDLELTAPAWTIQPADLTPFAAAPGLAPFTALGSDVFRGFIRLRLGSPGFAFGHQDYGNLMASAIVTAVNSKGAPSLPTPPLSPSLLSLEASYTAIESRDLQVGKAGDDTLALFHLEPHGEWEVTTAKPECLPAPPADGTFCLGLTGLDPGQEVALFFHLADGSGNPFEDYPVIAWEYLAGDAWVSVPSNALVADSTNTLRRTGVVVFGVPGDATTKHSRMPTGQVWLRATASGAVSALNRAYSVTAQAVEAVFVPQDNDLSRLGEPLAAGTITRLVTSRPEIKKVTQPLPSFDGRPAEEGERYYRRVSERLRHRQRAVALWDYERLVLEAFPQLHKVKCIPHASPDSELAPGHVTVVPVPIVTADAYDPLRPAASQDLLAEIRAFLQPLLSAHVQLHVVNPVYEEVQVEATLVLRPGITDTGFYETLAGAELTDLLTPWVSGDRQTLAFDARLYPSTILNFLEERDYVDYVSDFHVRQSGGSGVVTVDPPTLVPTTERSLLASARAHALKVQRSST